MDSDWYYAYFEIAQTDPKRPWPLRHIETGEKLPWPIQVAARSEEDARRAAVISVLFAAANVDPFSASAASLVLSLLPPQDEED